MHQTSIENLRKIVKDLLWLHDRPRIEALWDEVPLEQLQTHISSIAYRMEAIISSEGGSTRW